MKYLQNISQRIANITCKLLKSILKSIVKELIRPHPPLCSYWQIMTVGRGVTFSSVVYAALGPENNGPPTLEQEAN